MVMAKTLRTDSSSSHGGDESEIDFFFEFASSYSYLAAARIDPQAGTNDTQQRLRDETQTADELGIFGAPSFLARGELYWGHDRLEDAIRWAGSAAPGHQ